MKKAAFILLAICFSASIFAQGFASFTVEGSLAPAKIKFNTDKASTIEVIVSEKVDLKNVNFKYKLLSSCFLDKDLKKDFSNPQKVMIDKRDSDSKEWIISVKPLVPAPLPFELEFSKNNGMNWNTDVIGWAGIGIDESKPEVIRFGNHGVSFWVAIKEPAKKLSYELKIVSREPVKFTGEFVVETSADARTWNVLTKFDSKNQLTDDGQYENELDESVRYIRWTYVAREKLNLNLNNIFISAE